jgi:serine/threonine protein kinase
VTVASAILCSRRRDLHLCVVKEVQVYIISLCDDGSCAQTAGMTRDQLENVMNEVRILSSLNHPNIIRMIDPWSVGTT